MATSILPSFSNEQLQFAVNETLQILNEKERNIIQFRYAIHREQRSTLEELGQHYGITRERIRQIEANAIKKLEKRMSNKDIAEIIRTAERIIHEEGGLLNDVELKHRLLTRCRDLGPKVLHELHLILNLSQEIQFSSNTIGYHALWTYKHHPTPYKEIAEKVEKILTKAKKLVSLEDLLKKGDFADYGLSTKSLAHLLINKKNIRVLGDQVGLESWRHINPKTLKDKLIYILNKSKKAHHFRELSHMIKEENFDQKKCNPQAVHNELIRHEEFVLVGRGLYALKKWGFEAGTVGDVIYRILSDETPRTREEIVQEVLKQKIVKEITIYLNLRSHPKVARLGRNSYTIKKD